MISLRSCSSLLALGFVCVLSDAGESRAQQAPLYRVADLWTGVEDTGYAPQFFAAVGDRAYFMRGQAVGQFQVWQSDGTTSGTQQIPSIPGDTIATFVPPPAYAPPVVLGNEIVLAV
jgi:hypothetical protein